MSNTILSILGATTKIATLAINVKDPVTAVFVGELPEHTGGIFFLSGEEHLVLIADESKLGDLDQDDLRQLAPAEIGMIEMGDGIFGSIVTKKMFKAAMNDVLLGAQKDKIKPREARTIYDAIMADTDGTADHIDLAPAMISLLLLKKAQNALEFAVNDQKEAEPVYEKLTAAFVEMFLLHPAGITLDAADTGFTLKLAMETIGTAKGTKKFLKDAGIKLKKLDIYGFMKVPSTDIQEITLGTPVIIAAIDTAIALSKYDIDVSGAELIEVLLSDVTDGDTVDGPRTVDATADPNAAQIAAE